MTATGPVREICRDLRLENMKKGFILEKANE
jgi:hypothetical protein